jgi:hypothetical protein
MQALGRGQADPAVAAGDNSDLTFKPFHKNLQECSLLVRQQ